MKISHIFLIILTPISLVTMQNNALFKEVGQAVESTTQAAADVAQGTVQTAGDVAQDVIETPERIVDPYKPLFDTDHGNQPIDETYPLTEEQLQKVEAAAAVEKTIIPRARRTTTPYLGTAQRNVRRNIDQRAKQRVPYFQTVILLPFCRH